MHFDIVESVVSYICNAQFNKRLLTTSMGGGGLLHLKPPKFEHIFVDVITFFLLSSVQILLIPACCLLCVL